jgi:hypothetical protein
MKDIVVKLCVMSLRARGGVSFLNDGLTFLRLLDAPSESSRSRGSAFYCVPYIDFGYALVDFESLTVTLLGRRYLLEGSNFALMAELLLAEGRFLSALLLAERLGLKARYANDSLNRIAKRLLVQMRLHGQEDLLEQSRRGYRILLPDTASLAMSKAS